MKYKKGNTNSLKNGSTATANELLKNINKGSIKKSKEKENTMGEDEAIGRTVATELKSLS